MSGLFACTRQVFRFFRRGIEGGICFYVRGCFGGFQYFWARASGGRREKAGEFTTDGWPKDLRAGGLGVTELC